MTMIDMPSATDLRRRLRASRLLADLEQDEIAERIGVSRGTVSNWERGRSEPGATFFVRWAHATGVSLDWLAAGINDETPTADAMGVSESRPRESNPRPFHYE